MSEVELSDDQELTGRIQNPLKGLSREVLYKMVDDFCTEHDFADKRDIFIKASVLAQNPNDFESLPELNAEDKELIRRETTRKSRRWAVHSRQLDDADDRQMVAPLPVVLPHHRRFSGFGGARMGQHRSKRSEVSWTSQETRPHLLIGSLSFPLEFGIEDNHWLTGMVNAA